MFAQLLAVAFISTHPITHYTPKQMDQLAAQHEAMLKRDISLEYSQTGPLPESVNLSQYLLTPSDARDQKGCGNCYIWANTGNIEILSTLNGGNQPLSEEYINSGFALQGRNACSGGLTSEFVAWYNIYGQYFIPSSNINAGFTDQDGQSNTSFYDISQTPNIAFTTYPIKLTYGLDGTLDAQDTAVAAIKNALNNNTPVIYSFALDTAGIYQLTYFWANEDESAIWDPTPYQTTTFDTGHQVLIVGYDQTSWIVQNSWGTTPTRPNGQFRLTYNLIYGLLYQNSKWYVANYFETVPVTFATSSPVDGACGSIDGKFSVGPPTGGLCSVGRVSAIQGTGPWTWSCIGSSGGRTATCSTISMNRLFGCNSTDSSFGVLTAVGLFFIRRRKTK